MKGKELANAEDDPISIPFGHPLVEFSKPITSLECRTIYTYHRFEVPKKGNVERSIIFHAQGDMDRHGRQGDEERKLDVCKDSHTSRELLSKKKIICYSLKSK